MLSDKEFNIKALFYCNKNTSKQNLFHFLTIRWIFIIWIIQLYAPFKLFGQEEDLNEEWRWAHFSVSSGLPSNDVKDVVELEDGSVWARTVDRVVWFDGYRWIPISPELGLPHDQVQQITAGWKNDLLVILGQGLYRGNQLGFNKIELPDSMQNGRISSVVAIDTNSILLSYICVENSGLYSYHNANSIKRVFNKSGKIWKTQSGKVWFSTQNKLFSLTNEIWIQRELEQACTGIDFSAIKELVENKNGLGALIVDAPIQHIGVWEWVTGKNIIHSKSERGLPVRSIDISEDNNMLAVYETGEIRIRKDMRWSTLKSKPSFLTDIKFCRYGKDNNLWVSTSHGLYLFKSKIDPWTRHLHPFGDEKNIVMEIFKAKNNDIWIGNNDGVEIISQGGGKKYISSIQDTRLGLVTGINEDSEGNIWISSGSSFHGAYRWDGNKWEHIYKNKGLNSEHIHKIRKDRKGRLWFLGIAAEGKEPGAYVLEKDKFYSWNSEKGLLHDRVYSFVETKNGALFFGTQLGLSRYHNGKWKHWSVESFGPYEKVYALCEDNTGRVWFSNFSSSLGYIDHRDSIHWIWEWNSMHSYRSKVWDIQIDSSNALWVATTDGLFRINENMVSEYPCQNGISMRELRVVMPLEKEVYVGGHGCGIGILSKKALQFPIRIDLNKPIIETNNIYLSWDVFAYWGAISSDQIEIRYRFDNGDWSKWSKARDVQMEGLMGGDHSFEIQSRDIYGNIRNNVAFITFSIPQAFFLQPAYVFSLAIFSLVLGTTIVRTAILRRRDLNEDKKNRDRIASDLHDEVGSNLGSIALMSQRLQRNKLLPIPVRDELSIIARTSLETADYLRDIIWYVNPQNDSMVNLVDRLKEIACIMLNDISLNIIVEDEWNNTMFTLALRRNVYLMFKEVVHNILKHSNASEVVITFKRHRDEFIIVILDNGIGFDVNNVSNGNGLSNLHKRAQKNNVNLKITSNIGKGTCIGMAMKNNVYT